MCSRLDDNKMSWKIYLTRDLWLEQKVKYSDQNDLSEIFVFYLAMLLSCMKLWVFRLDISIRNVLSTLTSFTLLSACECSVHEISSHRVG